MGCSDSTDQRPQFSVEQKFMELGLSNKLDNAQFQNATEKEIFMAINVCRVIPRHFVQICKEVGQSNPIAEKTPFKHSLYQAM